MTTDWGFAVQVGGVGFGLVFVVLIILALAMWLIGLVVRRLDSDKGGAAEKKKGD